jgi:hypothetical protein
LSPAGFWQEGDQVVATAVLLGTAVTSVIAATCRVNKGDRHDGGGSRMGLMIRTLGVASAELVFEVTTNWFASLPG